MTKTQGKIRREESRNSQEAMSRTQSKSAMGQSRNLAFQYKSHNNFNVLSRDSTPLMRGTDMSGMMNKTFATQMDQTADKYGSQREKSLLLAASHSAFNGGKSRSSIRGGTAAGGSRRNLAKAFRTTGNFLQGSHGMRSTHSVGALKQAYDAMSN